MLSYTKTLTKIVTIFSLNIVYIFSKIAIQTYALREYSEKG